MLTMPKEVVEEFAQTVIRAVEMRLGRAIIEKES